MDKEQAMPRGYLVCVPNRLIEEFIQENIPQFFTQAILACRGGIGMCSPGSEVYLCFTPTPAIAYHFICRRGKPQVFFGLEHLEEDFSEREVARIRGYFARFGIEVVELQPNIGVQHQLRQLCASR